MKALRCRTKKGEEAPANSPEMILSAARADGFRLFAHIGRFVIISIPPGVDGNKGQSKWLRPVEEATGRASGHPVEELVERRGPYWYVGENRIGAVQHGQAEVAHA